MELAVPFNQSVLPTYETHYAFTAAKYNETVWKRLLPNSLEGYRYHLAFELGGVAGFKVGYVSVLKAGIAVCIAPIFIMDYALDSTVQGKMKSFTQGLNKLFPNLMTVRLLCVGSPVTDAAQIGIYKDHPFYAEIINALNEKLEVIAEREGASVIAFKDIVADEAAQLKPILESHGFSSEENMPIAKNLINFEDIDGYLATLSYSTRKSLRRKLKLLKELRIEEHEGLIPHIEKIYELYLNCYTRSELKFEKLTLAFFESLAGLMPDQCRYVLYFRGEKLIGFNCLLHGDGVLIDKYIGLDYEQSKEVNLYSLSWLYNIQMCIRDGFHTFQSGQAAYETKLSLGATLEQTYIFFKHRNKLLNPLLKIASKALAYGNFDSALSSTKKSN